MEYAKEAELLLKVANNAAIEQQLDDMLENVDCGFYPNWSDKHLYDFVCMLIENAQACESAEPWEYARKYEAQHNLRG